MNTKKILNLLHNYYPHDLNEIEYKKEIINFIINNENCFQRYNLSGHMTASGWLINKTGDLVLLMHHTKLNEWFQFGGHADGDSDLLKVAIKETQEESGLLNVSPVMETIFDIDIHAIPEHKNVPPHLHYDIRFLLQLQDNKIEQKNEESMELKWFSKNLELFPNKKASMLRMFKKWQTLDK